MGKRGCAVLLAALVIGGPAFARGSGGHHHGHGSHAHRSTYAVGVQRDSRGHIKRSRAAIYSFRRDHACPSTGRTAGACPGYVIDHIEALKRGGADAPANMQWQTTDEAKEKDRTE